MQSRVGRNKQRYGDLGERLIAGVVPLSQDRTKVLIVQSTRRNGWILPKGGWETDERLAADAATREAWEEAGIVCRVLRDLGTIKEIRPTSSGSSSSSSSSTTQMRSLYYFYEVLVEKEEERWPEMDRRVRMWVSYAQAESALRERPALLEALARSSIIR
ncbi:MAG: hypothetical protein M1813_000152 [Trichoglossum hirsutum]|nr:MAG: hypothetical protein M1813_000152 [Trichoglossum hirsutum]